MLPVSSVPPFEPGLIVVDDDRLFNPAHTHTHIHQLASGSGASPHLVARFAGHTDSVEAVAISPDGRHLVSSGWDGSLRIWRMGQQVLEEAAAAAAAGGGANGDGVKASSKKRK
eukprot:scaffold135138_cov19-Tisochrysis_lutea.AAC.1